MSKILDRYIIREVLPPLLLGLLVLTFVLEIPPILREGEQLIAKGVDLATVGRVLLTLLPQALGLTIPMSVLLGLLIGLGRISADREYVALQACGISLARLLRPVAVIAVVGIGATTYEMIVALPNANQTFREITVGLVATRAESNIKPHVFFEDFPDRVVYVRDTTPGGGWRDVFLADSSRPGQTDVYLSKEGGLVVDRERHRVLLQLKNGRRHTVNLAKPDEYQATAFGTFVLSVDPASVFPRPPAKGVPEMTIAELRQQIAVNTGRHEPSYPERFMIQQKFSIPAACVVLALIGLGLGASNRKDGKLASFVLGFIVIFVYYVLLWLARALALGGKLPAPLAPWVPNVVLGAAGVALVAWRLRAADQPIRISIPAFWRRTADVPTVEPARKRRPRMVLLVKVPHLNLPRPSLLDLYVARQYLTVFLLGVVSLLGIFYISTFMDLADKLFKGTATTALLLRYFFYATPQFVYYVIPMSVLISTLVTIGLMTKNSELVVMKACGISLYRASVPILLFSIAASVVLFALQERVLAYSNREADRLNAIIRRYPTRAFNLFTRRWMVGTNGDIYHYEQFDAESNRFVRFSTYRIADESWRLAALSYASEVHLATEAVPERSGTRWIAKDGWTREFDAEGNSRTSPVRYHPFGEHEVSLEAPAYFKTEDLEPDRMTYGQLRSYITRLRTTGFNAVPQMVELQRKVAFPLVTLVMTLIAVPFAVTTGRRGALYGVGVGIVLAIVYWITLSVFAAMGAGGLIAPLLAAWAPNILFAAAAAYLILTVRT